MTTLADVLTLTIGGTQRVAIYIHEEEKIFPEKFVGEMEPDCALQYLEPKFLESEVRYIGVRVTTNGTDDCGIKVVVEESKE